MLIVLKDWSETWRFPVLAVLFPFSQGQPMGVEVMDMLCWTQHTFLFPGYLSELNCSLFLFAFPFFLCCLLEDFSEALDLRLWVQVNFISCAAGANAASWTTWQEMSWEPDSWHHLCQNQKMLLSQTLKPLSGGLKILHPCPVYGSMCNNMEHT